MHLSRLLTAGCILLCLFLGTACRTGPIATDALPEPELVVIQSDLERIVAQARSEGWLYGWDGNDAVKASGEDGSVMGYCWHWQERVFAAVAPTVRGEGWDLVRININRDWFSEHHAVAVWDPKEIRRDELLQKKQPVWVLDPWLEGKPQILSLDDWLAIPVIVFEPAGLELDAAAP